MAKLIDYPADTRFNSDDILIKDGSNGTKKILVTDAAVEFAGMISTINPSNKFGVATHDYGGAAADWVLTKNEANCGILIVTNAGGTANIIAPDDLGRFFFVKNDSGYDVVVKSAGAEAGTTIADGNSVIVFNTGN